MHIVKRTTSAQMKPGWKQCQEVGIDKCSLLFFLIVLFRLPPRRERQQQLQSLLLATTAAATSMRATPQTLPNRCKNWNVPLW